MSKEKKAINISVIELSNYERPESNEFVSMSNDYVLWGQDNSVFEDLINAYDKSVSNKRIINGISSMIYGRGLSAIDASRKPADFAAMISLFKPEEIRKIVDDFKKLGRWAAQVIYSGSGNARKVAEVFHIEVAKLGIEEADDDGKINGYYFTNDWKDIHTNPPERFSAFGTSKDSTEILYVKPYQAGHFYFPQTDYQAGMTYADMESNMGEYHVTEIQHGFAANKLINFNNGVPDPETQKLIERKVNSKFAGSNSKSKIVFSFNDSKETAATIDNIELGDAHERYQFLSTEAEEKLMMAHSVVYPLFTSRREATGLGNNAEELKNAYILMDNTVIKPKQDFIIEGLDKILAVNGIVLNLFFKTIQPLEFTDLGNTQSKDDVIEETGNENLSSHKCTEEEKKAGKCPKLLEDFGEEEDLDEWELIDETPVDYDNEEDLDKEVDVLNNPRLSALKQFINLVSTGDANPNEKSSQDKALFKVRYQYAPLSTSGSSREFCDKMVSAKKIYRKEDILAMGSTVVNAGWGKGGADTYSIWFYKGGGDCHRFWMRKTYKRKRSGGKFLPNKGLANDKEVSVNSARREGFTPEKNNKKVATRPTDMPNSGFVKKR
ncbi:MAG: hypothetical protein JKY54_04285 [Flavobacteriales bacterium]|nr:hypothetical protein [Flavobacteriales bacterium]